MGVKNCRSNYKTIFFVFIFIFTTLNISAQVETPDSSILERIRLIGKMLDRGKHGADRWWYGWLVGYSAATIGQSAVLLSNQDKVLRQDMVLGATTTLLGVAGQLITPMTPSYAPERLTKMPEDNHEARLQKLQNAEELLKASAQREKAGRSWQTHAIAGAVNVSSGLITWLGFKRNMWAGVENIALNTIITEAQIWTQPTKAMKDYQNYCKRFKSGEKPIALKSDIIWFVGVSPAGMNIRIVF